MMSFDESMRFMALRAKIIWATQEALKEDNHHKSSEAACSIIFSMPSMFDDDPNPKWGVQIYSYVLGCGEESWHGKTLAEALSKAEDAVDDLVFPYKMREMDRFMEHDQECAVNAPLLCNCETGKERELYNKSMDSKIGRDPGDEVDF